MPNTTSGKQWFATYARTFSSVEINYTFYRLPDESTFDRWREEAPEEFVYAIKANRYLTHVKRLKDCEEALDRFWDRCRRLGPHLGPIPYQLPPNWRVNADRLDLFTRLLPADRTRVFEFRDNRWFVEPVPQILDDRGLTFCVHDHEGVNCPSWTIGSTAYFRYHGSRKSPDGGYPRSEIERHAKHVLRALEQGLDVYVYYNNDAYGCAVHNARDLQTCIDVK